MSRGDNSRLLFAMEGISPKDWRLSLKESLVPLHLLLLLILRGQAVVAVAVARKKRVMEMD